MYDKKYESYDNKNALVKKNRIKSHWMISNKVHYIFFVKLKYSYHSKVHRKSGNEIRSEKQIPKQNYLKTSSNRRMLFRTFIFISGMRCSIFDQHLKSISSIFFSNYFNFILKFTGNPEMKTVKSRQIIAVH